MLKNDLLNKINEKMPLLTKGQKKLATFILNNYDEAAFMTASNLGKVVGVSESSVVRFATEMGFNGYPQMQAELENLIKTNLTAVQRMEVSNVQMSKSNKDILTNILEKDCEGIKSTLSTIDKDVFDKCVNKIIKAKKVYIIGVRSASSLSSFLAFYLNIMLDNVIYINCSSSEIFEQIFKIQKDDVLIGISFPRYSKRTIKAMEYAFFKKATTIAITDSKNSPLTHFATNSLIARSDIVSFIDSLVAPLSLINALLVAISIAKKDDVTISLENLEKIWNEYEVYNYKQNFR